MSPLIRDFTTTLGGEFESPAKLKLREEPGEVPSKLRLALAQIRLEPRGKELAGGGLEFAG